jgi:hypothetical protein
MLTICNIINRLTNVTGTARATPLPDPDFNYITLKDVSDLHRSYLNENLYKWQLRLFD